MGDDRSKRSSSQFATVRFFTTPCSPFARSDFEILIRRSSRNAANASGNVSEVIDLDVEEDERLQRAVISIEEFGQNAVQPQKSTPRNDAKGAFELFSREPRI